ncbi:rod-binding protein [Desulfovibrio sp.]|uniref:rod-binding protein n=1 Tax=Desulfovibrio sp. TaxID=885 RepID=UPI003D0A6040
MTSPLTTGLVPHEASGAEVSRREFQSRLAGVGNLNGKKMTEADKEKKLREACEGFESIFIQKMWQEMRNTLPKTNMLQGREEQYWQSMYDQELAKSMTAAGGIGLADMMYSQLSRNLVSASRGTASAKSGSTSGFVPQVASVLPQDGEAASQAEGQDGSQGRAGHTAMRGRVPIPSVYDGIAPVQDMGESMQIQVLPAGTGSAQAALATAGQPASQPPLVVAPPEVEQALAALRARKEAAAKQEEQRVPNMNTGLNMARAAQFEAGSKLGAHAVLPRTHLSEPARNAAAGNGQTGQMTQARQAAQAQQAAQALDMQMRMAQSMGTPAAIQAAMQTGQPGPIGPLAEMAPGQEHGQTFAQTSGQASGFTGGQAGAQAGAQAGMQGAMQAGIPVPRPQQASQPAGGVITPGPAMAAGQQAGQQAGQEAAQEPHIQKVRYTTNVPPGQRKTSANDILHSLAAENATGPQSGPQQGQHPVQQHGPQQAGQPAAAGHEAAQQPQLQKVRYTTNVPPGQRKTSASDILRNSSVDAVGPNSRAGAGLAAYHAQQAGQPLQAAPGQPQAPATIQPLQAPTQNQAGQPAPVLVGQSAAGESVMPVTPQAGQAPHLAQPTGGYGIPPLTAMDLRR